MASSSEWSVGHAVEFFAEKRYEASLPLATRNATDAGLIRGSKCNALGHGVGWSHLSLKCLKVGQCGRLPLPPKKSDFRQTHMVITYSRVRAT